MFAFKHPKDDYSATIRAMADPHLCVEIDFDIKDLVPGYLARRRIDVIVGRDALRIGDYTALHKLGHNIRCSAGSFGFLGLCQIADRLERGAIAQDGKALSCALDDMHGYLERVEVVFRHR